MISSPYWYGEGSGTLWDTLITKVLPKTRGTADLIYCWEGGDSYTGIRVQDGKVTEHEVVQSLGNPK